jgi:hypothetical protein
MSARRGPDFGPQHDRPRDRDALTLAARELVGIAREHVGDAAPGRKADLREHVGHALAPLGHGQLGHVQRDPLADDLLDVIRGLNDAKGSWNTTCMRRRMARRVVRLALSRRTPSRVTLPAAIGCSASSAMPSVVLPDPDSPTIPSVSPRRSCSVAWRTAVKAWRPNQPLREEKSTVTSCAAASTGASAATGCTLRRGRLLMSLTV